MKKFQFFIILIAIANYSFGQTPTSEASVNFKKLNWLIGTWNRTNAKPGQSGHERWEQINPTELNGFGVNLKGMDTTFIEKLRIVIKDNNIYYIGDVPENQKPVYFKLTEIVESGFVCENPEHDFPKKISYHLDGKKLKAQISGDGKVIDYLFEKK